MAGIRNSSARVMATCGGLGQAAGTAAALAVRMGMRPGQIYPDYISVLQQELLEDSCYLPWRLIRFPAHIPHQIPDRQRLAVVIALIKAAAQLRQHIALLLCLNIFCQDAQVKALGHSYNA